MVAVTEAAVSKQTFKQFLSENGFPFLNVYNNDMETLFGHKEKDYEKKPKKKVDKDEKNKRKLNAYLRYAKNINEEQQ